VEQQIPEKGLGRRAAPYVLLLAAPAVLYCLYAGLPSKAGGYKTAMQLFESPRIHEVATHNIITIGEHLAGKGKVGPSGPVRRLVEQGFQKASLHLRNVDPAAARAFDSIPVTKEHEEAIAHALSYLSDKRVSKLGLKIAHAVRDAKSEDPEVVKRHIGRALFHDMDMLWALNHEIYPKGSPLRSTGGEDDLTQNPKALRKMASVSNAWDKFFLDDDDTAVAARRLPSMYANPSSGGGGNSGGIETDFGTPIGTSENVVGLAGAVMEEAGTMLRIMKPLAKMVGTDLNVPPDVTTGIGAADLAMELGSCYTDAMADDINPLELAACPVEFGSQAYDTMRTPLAMLGILGDNNPANGQQGNHNGKNQKNATLGMLDDMGWMDQSDIDQMDPFNSN